MISVIGLVGQQRLEHAEADRLVDDPPDQRVALAGGEDDALAGHQVRHHPLQPHPALARVEPAELVQVDLVEQLALERRDEALVEVAARRSDAAMTRVGVGRHGVARGDPRRSPRESAPSSA